MVEATVLSAVQTYLDALPAAGIRAERAVLFGSHARGRGSADSDIDLVVIAPEFDGPRDLATVKRLWAETAAADSRIEPIPCGEKEWAIDGERPILEIARREGIVATRQQMRSS